MASIYRRKKKGPYYITYVIRHGVRKTVKGCRDRAATEAWANRLEGDALLRRKGVIDPRADQYAKAEARPLMVKDAEGNVTDGHLADFYASLVARDTTPEHATLVRARAAKILDLAKADRLSTLNPSAVQAAIASLRSGDDPLSLQTCNHYLRAIKQFSRWLWRDGRTREDPLAHLSGYNVQLDRRHDRRALADEELTRLIQAAEKGSVVRGMTGPERATLYQLAVGTGFRANELRSLTPESFDLDADPPTVTVQAGYSKHRRSDLQPIRRDLADLLRPWLVGKTTDCPVFHMPDKPIKLIRADLDAAREAWLKEAPSEEARNERRQSDFLEYRDSAGRFIDFHALRHTYISRLVQSGANIKVAQELARHSTPTLTLGRYAHIQLVDQTRALDALPSIDTAAPEHEAAKATGTDNATALADEPAEARSAIAARRRPGASRRVINRRDTPLGNLGEELTETVGNAATCEDLSLPNNKAGGGIRTPNPRFTKPVLCR